MGQQRSFFILGDFSQVLSLEFFNTAVTLLFSGALFSAQKATNLEKPSISKDFLKKKDNLSAASSTVTNNSKEFQDEAYSASNHEGSCLAKGCEKVGCSSDQEPTCSKQKVKSCECVTTCTKKKKCKTQRVCPPEPVICLNPAYNHPARPEPDCSWDFSADASFIYWLAIEEQLNLAEFLNTSGIQNPVTTNQVSVIEPDFDFKPGFKVGLAINSEHDSWSAWAEYTRFHSKSETKARADLPSVIEILNRGGVVFNKFSQNWQLNMDILDVCLGRMYYVGTRLTFETFFGSRAAWIDQRNTGNVVATNDITIPASSATFATTVAGSNISLKNKSDSWAVGFEAGLNTNWNISKSFWLYGNAEADILFTRYKLKVDQLVQTQSKNSAGFISSANLENILTQHKLNRLRSHIDLELGIGWGSYFSCRDFYFDLTAGYGFQVFFDQNIFEFPFVYNNLYINGLTVTAQVTF